MKTIYDGGKFRVLLNEETGIVSLTYNGLSCSPEGNGLTVTPDGYKEKKIHLEVRPGYPEYLGGVLKVSVYHGSWDWTTGRIERQ